MLANYIGLMGLGVIAILAISAVPMYAQAQRPSVDKLKAEARDFAKIISGDKNLERGQDYGQGRGWIDRLEQALKSGAVLPVTAVAMPGTSALYGRDRAALPSRAQHHLTLAAARLIAFATVGNILKDKKLIDMPVVQATNLNWSTAHP